MRPVTLVSLLLIMVVAGMTLPAAARKAASTPVAEVQEPPGHPLVGSWQLSTNGPSAGEPTRDGVYTFRADGSILVVFESRPNGTGTAEPIWWGEGSWEATGDAAVRYTMAWRTKDDPEAPAATVTFDGVLTMSGDSLTFADDREESIVTLRNERGILIATFGIGNGELTAAVTGHRFQVGSR